VLDACVLYPPSLRDLLLTLAALDAYDVVWSETILAEVERNVLADHPDIEPARSVVTPSARCAPRFPGALVEPLPDEVAPFGRLPWQLPDRCAHQRAAPARSSRGWRSASPLSRQTIQPKRRREQRSSQQARRQSTSRRTPV
jgi:hypothetical protein